MSHQARHAASLFGRHQTIRSLRRYNLMSSSQTQDHADAVQSHRILIVEDDFLIRLTLSEVLSDEGYIVLEAETGDDALAILQRTPEIAILLTDIQLPGTLDGRALVQQARRFLPDLPVIFMTGQPDPMQRPSTAAREVFVTKPYLPSEICRAVKAILTA